MTDEVISWVDCADELPAFGTVVLALTPIGVFILKYDCFPFAHLKRFRVPHWEQDSRVFDYCRPTHWAALPKGPGGIKS